MAPRPPPLQALLSPWSCCAPPSPLVLGAGSGRRGEMLPINEQGKHCSDWFQGGGHSVYINGNCIITSSVPFDCHRGEREDRQRAPPASCEYHSVLGAWRPDWEAAPGAMTLGLGLEGGSPVDSSRVDVHGDDLAGGVARGVL